MKHDFYDSSNNTPILFGRPFLKTANAKIDCGKDTLSMEVGDTIKRLMSYPKCRSVEVINNRARPGSNHRKVNYIKL